MQPRSTSPLISVALCTYNGERFLRAQLDSVLAQRDVRLEVVAVDDASRDGSPAILREYAQRDPRVRLAPNPGNLGPLRSFERAMSLCIGDFIAPCDQDDVWHPDKLSTLLAAIGNSDLAYCDSEYIDADGLRSGQSISDDMAMLSGRHPLQFVFTNSVSGHALLAKRSLFEVSRPFPAGIFHDWWLAICASAENGITFVDQPLVGFRRHDNAFSPIGRKSQASVSPNREWLEECCRRLDAMVLHRLGDHESTAELARGFRLRTEGGSSWRLLQCIWRLRESAPRKSNSSILNAFHLHTRLLRKCRRARLEPERTAPQFRL